MDEHTIERFMNKVVLSNDGCWNWIGCRDRKGYGEFKSYRGASARAHRFSYSAFVGDIPDGMCVCHKCDNRACVNPSHLFVGTNHDNVLDRHRKGRSVIPDNRGSNNYNAKLTESDVRRIRELCNTMTDKEIAHEFNMSQNIINRIRNRVIWRHV